MKIGILLLGLAASLATAAPAQNQTTTAIAPARNSTTGAGRNNSVSAKGCINTTLMWRRVHVYDFFRDPKSKFEFTVDGVYYGEIPAHEDGYRRLKWCSHDNWKFCVTHFAGQVDQSVTIQFNGHDYYHKYANKFYHNDQQEDWLYEYWDCMVL